MSFDSNNHSHTDLTGESGDLRLLPNAAAYPRHSTVHELFEARVALSPEVVAVVSDEYEITYAELNARANQLAHYLRRLGVGKGTAVAIGMDRSPELAAGVLAILKAGGAYVPLDETYPRERLAFMLEQSGATVLLTKSASVDKLPTAGMTIVAVDTQWPVIGGESEENPTPLSNATDPCYMIFTSGSTGTPKGVAMPHRPLVNLIWWHLHSPDAPGGGEGGSAGVAARTMQFAPISFDVSFQEMFSTWGSGGTLVLVTEELRLDPDALLGYIARHSVERLYLPVVALIQLADAHAAGQPAPVSVREVITAGEALHVTPSVASLFASLPGCTLHNHYGPSETHVVTAHVLSGDPAAWPALPPIGRPIWNTAAYLLDADMQAAGAGEEGELYLGGECLASGYVGRDDLTAERFIEIDDPLGSGEKRRVYKTGDRVRVGDDGALDYLGRADQQIKVRGYRVEPGEIEQCLPKMAAITQAAVVAKVLEDGDTALAVYFTVNTAEAPAVSEMRAHLRETLPDYMIPAMFVALESLPTTPSGKVDRKSLAARPLETHASTIPHVHRGAIRLEDAIAEIWRDVLHSDSVGYDDNFFEAGGTSLQAVRAYRRLKSSSHCEFPITILFQYPTITLLAKYLRDSGLVADNSHAQSGETPRRDPLAHLKSLRSHRTR
ncbi:MAG TPA: non-ribosomal peptide synthetase [Capsulimonadaceae bacterium]|jgi:amino acid adenylation domain-containing protein